MKAQALTPARLRRHLGAMRGRRVAVVGDSMLDEFLWGDATRISPEAPVPVVLLERRTWSLGGAANVAANVAGLGGRALLFTVAGADEAGARLRRLAEDAGIGLGAWLPQTGRPTTVKHRIFARNKHLLRFDQEVTTAVGADLTRALLRSLRDALPEVQAVVISDYGKGGVTPELVRGVARLCQAAGIPWCADPKTPTLRYRQATVVKPNLAELELLAGLPARNIEDLRRAAAKALRQQSCRYLLVTRGQQGMALFGADGTERLLNSGGQSVADVTGAGDTVSAVLGLGLGAGLDVATVAAIANLAGGYVVSVPGTAVARSRDLLDQIEQARR